MTGYAAGTPVSSLLRPRGPKTKIDLLIMTRVKETYDESLRKGGVHTFPEEIAGRVLATPWLFRELSPMSRSGSGVYQVIVKYIQNECRAKMQHALDNRGERLWENFKDNDGRFRWLPAKTMTVRMHLKIARAAGTQAQAMRIKERYHDAIARLAQERGLGLDDSVVPVFDVIQPLAIKEAARAA